MEPEPAKKVTAPAPEGNGLGWGANLITLLHIRYAPTRSQLADTGSTSPNNVKVGAGVEPEPGFEVGAGAG